jgi:membrane protein DedA with SNARE-associated domain
VSVAAAVSDRHPLAFAAVLAFGAAGAYAGDIATYGLLRLAGVRMAQRIGWLREGHPGETLARLRHGVEEHELPVLLTSRLVPGGRVPVLLAAALGGYSWRRFAVADIAAATLWSFLYAVIGVAGRAIFPEPWQAALAAVVLVVAVSAAGALWKRHRDARVTTPSTSSQ